MVLAFINVEKEKKAYFVSNQSCWGLKTSQSEKKAKGELQIKNVYNHIHVCQVYYENSPGFSHIFRSNALHFFPVTIIDMSPYLLLYCYLLL